MYFSNCKFQTNYINSFEHDIGYAHGCILEQKVYNNTIRIIKLLVYKLESHADIPMQAHSVLENGLLG